MRLRTIPLLTMSALVALALSGCLAVPGLVAQQASPASVVPSSEQLDLFPSADTEVLVEIFSDFGCSYCREFMDANADYLADAAAEDHVSTVIVPVSILDSRFDGSKYSTRAANAVYCVATLDTNQGATSRLVLALFDAQPAEGSRGLTDAQIMSVASQASGAGAPLESCILHRSAAAFVASSTEMVTTTDLSDSVGPLVGTPTVLVNGQQYEGATDDAAAFEAFVAAAG